MSHAAIEFEHVTYAYPGGKPALEDITLRIEPGERLGVLGPNGGGKTTLIKLALGLLEGYQGRISVFGRTPRQAQREGIIGCVPQRCEAELSFPISVWRVVEMAASRRVSPLARTPRDVRERIGRSLDLVGARDLANRPVAALSGGQLQRVLMARALASDCRVLALDEPTVGVDVVGQRRFAELLERLHKELDLTIIIVSHDVRAIASGSDRVVCLSRRMHYHASPEGLTPQVLAEVFSHEVEAAFGDVHIHAHLAEHCPGGEDGHAHRHGCESPGEDDDEGVARAHD